MSEDPSAPDALVAALTAERVRLGLSQAEIAARMGVPRLAIVRLEDDPSKVAFGRIMAYAKAVGAEILVKLSDAEATPLRRGRPVGSKS